MGQQAMKWILALVLCLAVACPVLAAEITLPQSNGTKTPMGGVGDAAKTTGGGFTFVNITTNATTVVKSGAGFVHTVCVLTAGATDTATIYNNTAGSGTTIGTLDTALTGCFQIDAIFTIGLTIVTAGTTPGNLSVSYY